MIQTRKKKKTWISWVVLLLLLIGAGTVIYLVWDSYFNDKKDNDENQETEQVEVKEDSRIEEESGGLEKKKVEQYEGEDPNKAEMLTGVVTYAGVSGDNLMIRMNIDQYLESGECRLILSREGITIYSAVAKVVGNASTATCEGFDVPINELGGGIIEIKVSINSGERYGVIHGETNI